MIYMVKKTSKVKNKTQSSLCLQTWLQQNLGISTNHKYRIYMDVFFCNQTFWRHDVLTTWHFVNLTPFYLTKWCTLRNSYQNNLCYEMMFKTKLCTIRNIFAIKHWRFEHLQYIRLKHYVSRVISVLFDSHLTMPGRSVYLYFQWFLLIRPIIYWYPIPKELTDISCLNNLLRKKEQIYSCYLYKYTQFTNPMQIQDGTISETEKANVSYLKVLSGHSNLGACRLIPSG